MARALRWTIGIVLALAILLLAAIQGAYLLGARSISPEWRASDATFPEAARIALWRSVGGTGRPVAEPTSSVGFAWRFADWAWHDEAPRITPGIALAGRAARHAKLIGGGTMADYHLMQIAASIQASRWPVDRQLDTVLEHMRFGDGHGFASGSRRMFGKDASELSTPQLHVLLAVGHAPAGFDPWCHADRLRGYLLHEVDRGHVDATPAELDAALVTLAPLPADHAPCATAP
jgi:hypothetical protein